MKRQWEAGSGRILLGDNPDGGAVTLLPFRLQCVGLRNLTGLSGNWPYVYSTPIYAKFDLKRPGTLTTALVADCHHILSNVQRTECWHQMGAVTHVPSERTWPFDSGWDQCCSFLRFFQASMCMCLNNHDRVTLRPCRFVTNILKRFLVLSNKYRFSLPAVPLRVRAVVWVEYMHTISEPTGSVKRYFPDKIMIPYYSSLHHYLSNRNSYVERLKDQT